MLAVKREERRGSENGGGGFLTPVANAATVMCIGGSVRERGKISVLIAKFTG